MIIQNDSQELKLDLIQLNRQAKELGDEILASEGELTDLTEAKLRAAEFGRRSSADQAAHHIKYFQAQAMFWKKEKLDAQKLQSSFEKAEDIVREIVSEFIQSCHANKLNGSRVTFSLQDNPGSVDVFDLDALPDHFTKRVPNLSKIKEAIDAGELVPGANLVKSKSLRMRKASNVEISEGEPKHDKRSHLPTNR